MNASPADPVNVTATTGEDKTAAILAYITLIGFIIAIVLNGQKKTRLGSYHLRQALGLLLTAVACMFYTMIPFLGWVTGPFIGFGILVLAVMGIIAAANGQLKPVPLLGEHFQKWFGTAFE